MDFFILRKELTTFLRGQCWSVNVRGDTSHAQEVIKDLRHASDSRKRDDKRLFKELKDAEKPEDKSRALNKLFEEIIDRYSGVLIRCIIIPKQWLNAEFPIHDPDNEVIYKGLIKGKIQRMNDCHKNAIDLMSPESIWENEILTLKNFVDQHGTEHDPIDCVRLVSNSGHGQLLRATVNLLFGERTKKRTIWITGMANSGKSMFVRRLRTIFASDEVDWRGVYLPVK